MFKIINI